MIMTYKHNWTKCMNNDTDNNNRMQVKQTIYNSKTLTYI